MVGTTSRSREPHLKINGMYHHQEVQETIRDDTRATAREDRLLLEATAGHHTEIGIASGIGHPAMTVEIVAEVGTEGEAEAGAGISEEIVHRTMVAPQAERSFWRDSCRIW